LPTDGGREKDKLISPSLSRLGVGFGESPYIASTIFLFFDIARAPRFSTFPFWFLFPFGMVGNLSLSFFIARDFAP